MSFFFVYYLEEIKGVVENMNDRWMGKKYSFHLPITW